MKKILGACVILCATIMALAMPAWAEPEWIKAEIKKVEPERLRIVLDHERINSIGMEAMTMLFDVSKEVPLNQFQNGEKVRFQVIIKDGALEVTALELRK